MLRQHSNKPFNLDDKKKSIWTPVVLEQVPEPGRVQRAVWEPRGPGQEPLHLGEPQDQHQVNVRDMQAHYKVESKKPNVNCWSCCTVTVLSYISIIISLENIFFGFYLSIIQNFIQLGLPCSLGVPPYFKAKHYSSPPLMETLLQAFETIIKITMNG